MMSNLSDIPILVGTLGLHQDIKTCALTHRATGQATDNHSGCSYLNTNHKVIYYYYLFIIHTTEQQLTCNMEVNSL